MKLARFFISWISLALGLFFVSCSQNKEPEPVRTARDVNVILITLDTTRPDYLSCYGDSPVETPHLDRLAKQGVLFTDAVAQVPLTLPSHACILTGAYPQTHKIRDNGGFNLDADIPTLATIASSAGLNTGAFVGAAILNRRFGLSRGFGIYSDEMVEREQDEKLPGVLAEVRAEVVTDRALEWLSSKTAGENKNARKRFLLWVHYYDPHFPYDPPEPFRSRYPNTPYGGEVAYIDSQIGRLLSWLEERGFADETLVVVIGDHGESLGEHGEYTHGVFLYDATVKVPFIMAGPDIPAGRTVDQQVRSIDVMPTIAEYLGVEAGEHVEGESLMPLLTGTHSVRSTYSYMETLYPRTAMGWSELRGVRAEEWKLIAAPKPELYRLREDRSEKQNVIDQYPEEADRLQKRVWEVAGDRKSLGVLQAPPMDDQTRRELESLGYVNVNRKREIRIDMSGPDPKDRVNILEVMEKAAAMINRDQYRPAISLLSPALNTDPTNPMLYIRLALCYERTGQYRKAIEVYQKAIEHEADNDQTYAELGELYVRVRQLEPAVKAMEQAAEMNPGNLQNLNNLATAYAELGRQQDAEKTLQMVLAQNADDPSAHNLAGILALSRGQGDLARIHFERAIVGNPNLAEPYLNLGLLAEQAGRLDQAAVYYRQFLEKASPDKHREVIPKVRDALEQLTGKS